MNWHTAFVFLAAFAVTCLAIYLGVVMLTLIAKCLEGVCG